MKTLSERRYCKYLKKIGHLKNCCNYPKIPAVWFYQTEMCQKGEDRMANSLDLDQDAPSGAV